MRILNKPRMRALCLALARSYVTVNARFHLNVTRVVKILAHAKITMTRVRFALGAVQKRQRDKNATKTLARHL
jgi:hypothetical protein